MLAPAPPARRLVYTWRWEGMPTETVVTVEFHADGEGTRVDLHQAGFPDAHDRDMHADGWAGCLDNLGRRSPRHLTPGLDRPIVGQPAMRIFRITSFERPHHLTFDSRKPLGRVVVTYAVLPQDGGCHLLMRIRWTPPPLPVPTALTTGAIAVVFLLLAVTFIVLGIGEASGTSGIVKLGGWIGLATAIAAWYASFAEVTNATFNRIDLLNDAPWMKVSTAGSSTSTRIRSSSISNSISSPISNRMRGRR